MSVEDGAKLYDVCPHVSDSVCGICSLYMVFVADLKRIKT